MVSFERIFDFIRTLTEYEIHEKITGALYRCSDNVHLMFQNSSIIVLMNYVEQAFYNKLHVVVSILYEYHSPLYVHYQVHKLNHTNE